MITIKPTETAKGDNSNVQTNSTISFYAANDIQNNLTVTAGTVPYSIVTAKDFTYQIVVTNTDLKETAMQVLFTDTPETGSTLKLESATTASASTITGAGTITLNSTTGVLSGIIGDITPGQAITITITAQVPVISYS